MVQFVYSELSRQICHERGFNSESLQCSSCADLPKFHLDELVADCNSCCRKDYVETKQEVQKFHLVKSVIIFFVVKRELEAISFSVDNKKSVCNNDAGYSLHHFRNIRWLISKFVNVTWDDFRRLKVGQVVN